MTDRSQRISAVLSARFQPELLRVVDESARHAGHSGAAAAGETHFNVLLVSSRFVGTGRVERSRLVHETLRSELESGLHALALTLRTPAEQAASEASR